MELSKSQKRIARELIRKALERECSMFMKNIKEYVQKLSHEEAKSHESYLALYKKVHVFDKHIGRRYDGMRGSIYFRTLLSLLSDKVLTKEDMAQFDEETQNHFFDILKSWEEDL